MPTTRRCSGTFRPAGPPDPHHGLARWARCCSARLLDLNDTQEGVLNVVFRYADEQGLLLLDLEDLQAMLALCRRERQAS